MHRILVLLISCLLLPIVAAGQATTRIAIRAGKLIDGRGEKPLENPLIQVEGDRIISVTAGESAPSGMEVVDLANATVLPGFIDVHTHLLLQGDVTAEEYDAQLLKSRFRTGRFSRHATRRLRYHTASSRCATWQPKERCTRM
ncbi:MAG: hypothetical protein WA628_25285 [Terriglobales bacterium]